MLKKLFVLAVFASAHAWALYTGLLSYVIIGVFAALEYLLHKFLFRFYGSGPLDSLWRRVCPPPSTALGRRTLDWQIARGQVGADGSPVRSPG